MSAQMELSLQMVSVNPQDALGVRSGLEQDVLVSKATTGTALSVFCVSMVKYGTKWPRPVSARPTLPGTATSARNPSIVQEEESGTRTIKFASAPTARHGMEPLALCEKPAVVEKAGMIPACNAIVHLASTGMAEHAYTAPTEKCGMHLTDPASARLALSGMANFAQ